MVYSTRNRDDVPHGIPGGVMVITMNPIYRFDLDDARNWLNQQESSDHWFITPYDWWEPQSREIAQVFDFLAYRGATVIHKTKRWTLNHQLYLSARLEKLYSDDILESWANA